MGIPRQLCRNMPWSASVLTLLLAVLPGGCKRAENSGTGTPSPWRVQERLAVKLGTSDWFIIMLVGRPLVLQLASR